MKSLASSFWNWQGKFSIYCIVAYMRQACRVYAPPLWCISFKYKYNIRCVFSHQQGRITPLKSTTQGNKTVADDDRSVETMMDASICCMEPGGWVGYPPDLSPRLHTLPVAGLTFAIALLLEWSIDGIYCHAPFPLCCPFGGDGIGLEWWPRAPRRLLGVWIIVACSLSVMTDSGLKTLSF